MRKAWLLLVILLVAGCFRADDQADDQGPQGSPPSSSPPLPTGDSGQPPGGDDGEDVPQIDLPPVLDPPPDQAPDVRPSWNVSACTFGASRVIGAPPDLLVMTANRGGLPVQRLSFSEGEYRVVATAPPADVQPAQSTRTSLATLGNDAYVITVSPTTWAAHVSRLGPNLSLLGAAPMDRVVALDAKKGVLYASNDSLVAFAPDLRVLGRIELPLKDAGEGKTAHDVIVHNGTAFLLDDTIRPLYVLRVDVRDPAAMEVVDRQGVWGGHLPSHWLDLDARRWMVLHEWSRWGGVTSDLRVFPLAEGAEQARVQLSLTNWNGTTHAVETTEGFAILAHLETTPQWVVARNGTTLRFGSLDVDLDARILSFCQYPLELPPPGAEEEAERFRATVTRAGHHLVGAWGRTLFAVDLAASPPVLVSVQRLDAPIMALEAYNTEGALLR